MNNKYIEAIKSTIEWLKAMETSNEISSEEKHNIRMTKEKLEKVLSEK